MAKVVAAMSGGVDSAVSAARAVEAGHDAIVEKDAVESIVPLMPIVLPIVGGVLMLLLASIAVFLA